MYLSFIHRFQLLATLIACFVLLQGCTLSKKVSDLWSDKPEPFEAENAYQTGELQPELARVAILPVFNDAKQGPNLTLMDSVFYSELNKTLLFEVVPASRAMMKMQFGQPHFSTVDPIPAELFPKIKSACNAQAALFVEITHYDPYRPMAIGLRSKLADLETGQILWAFDQVFDAGDPRVAHSAMQYFEQLNTNQYPLNRAESILQSPERFSRFVAYAAFQTLPQRPVRYEEVGEIKK